MLHALSVLVLLLCGTSQAWSATRYVSTSGGGSSCSQSNPCSVSTGFDQTQAGDTLLFRGGDYGSIRLGSYCCGASLRSGTSASNQTTFASYPGERATVGAIEVSAYSGAGYRYITFDNFDLSCAGTENGIYIFGETPTLVEHITIKNTEVRNCAASGVNAYRSSDITFSKMHVHHNGSNRLDHGFYTCGRRMIIEDSDIHDNSAYGLQIYWHDPNGDRTCNDDVIIRRNRIHDHHGTDTSVTLDQGSRILFYNNLIYNATAGVASICQDAYGTQIFNNTFYGIQNTSVDMCSDPQVQNTQVRNNIFANSGSAVVIGASSSGTVTSNNLCYSMSGGTTGCDRSGNPNFTNPGSAVFTLESGSAAINQGTTLTNVPDDFLGNTRPAGAYDIGAYERGGTVIPPSGPVVRYMAPSSSGGSDSNNCDAAKNPASPKATFASVIPCMAAGDTLQLRGGTYSQVLRPTDYTHPNGTDYGSGAVTVMGYPNETAILTHQIDFNWTSGLHHWIFKNFTFDGTSQAQANGTSEMFYGGQSVHHVRFDNVTARRDHITWPGDGVCEACGVAFQGECDACEVINSRITGWEYGFYITGTNWKVDKNTIYDQEGYGVHIYNSNQTNVSGNVVSNNFVYDNGRTMAHHTTSAGIVVSSGSNNIVVNNVVSGQVNTIAGIQVGGNSTNNQVLNNTVYGNNGPGIAIDAGANSAKVTNNLIYNNVGDNIVNSGSGTSFATNLCDATRPGTANCAATTTDPKFVNAGTRDFQLQPGSPALNVGTTLAAVPTDITGTTRPQPPTGPSAFYDIGAYEAAGTSTPPSASVRYMAPSGASDSNTCEQSKNRSTPKANFGGANGALACMSPGDTLYLVGGTYNQGIRVPLPSGTSAAAVMTIASAPNETAVLAPNDNQVLDIPWDANKQYITFDRLVLDCTPGGDQCGAVYVGRGNHHIRFTNVEIKSNYNTVVRPENSAGIAISGAGDTIVLQNCNIHGFQRYGAYITGTNWVFDGCEVHHNGAYGLHIYNQGDTTVSGNIVRNSFVHHNSMIPGLGGAGSSGILLSSGSNNQAYNNVVYSNGEGNSNNIAGIQVGNSVDALVYNNTIYGNSGRCITMDSGSTGTKVKNNLCFTNGNPAEIVNDGATTDFSKNLCESPGGTGCDLVTTNPLFVNPTATPPDFRLNPGSPALDVGTNLPTAVPTDILGRGRPQPPGGIYDIGAYEMVSGAGRISPGIFYVDINAGVDPPGRTCDAALNNIAAPLHTFQGGRVCLIVAGDTLYLRAGTYTESLATAAQPITAGVSWTTPTKIAAYSNEIVTLRLPPTSDVLVYFNNADSYILLDRLILDCNNQANSNGLAMTAGSHHIRFQNGEIKNCYYEPVYIEGSDSNEILTSFLHGSVASPCVNLVSGSDNNLIRDNEISTCAGAGIQAASPNTGTIIRNNRIHDVGTTEGQTGIVTAGATSPVMINNVVTNNHRGIHLQAGTTNDAKVYNNTVHGNATQGLQIEPSAGAVVMNNIVAANTTAQIVNNGTGPTPTTNLTTAPPFDPAFPGRFHLTAAATTAINTGTALPADVPTDYEGVARPQPPGGQYDIGASEFVGAIIEPPPGVAIRMPYWRGQGFFWR